MHAHLDDSRMIGHVESGHDADSLGVQRYGTMAKMVRFPKEGQTGERLLFLDSSLRQLRQPRSMIEAKPCRMESFPRHNLADKLTSRE